MNQVAIVICLMMLSGLAFGSDSSHGMAGHGGEMTKDHQDHAKSAAKDHMLPLPLGISIAREGSGTSWLPDETPMYALHSMLGQWSLMFHANVFGLYIDEGGRRGDSQLGSVNWLMLMGRRPVGAGQFGWRTMVSAEVWTVGECGYPDLLATGEVCNGSPLHDRQHPHDLFMELSGFYQHALSDKIGFELYGGPSAEPALGPPAFPHRVSSIPNPLAPITHHWFDSTHISFGVFTAGVYSRMWKLEGSVFNGREPDQNRTNIDLAPLDSYSGRLQFLPNRRWSLQISAGHLKEAEEEAGGGRRIDADRLTTSAIYHRELPGGGVWATTFGYGRNSEEGKATNAVFLETNYNISNRHLFVGRAEWVEKSAHSLDLSFNQSEDQIYPVAKFNAEYVYQFQSVLDFTPGIGGGVILSMVPEPLKADYGELAPVGYLVFLSLRPRPME